ncbi:MAG TPA: lmo0937 family membrane protein [Candidatus Sulfotelmatobacter sp.]|nr:lmo0937 family membrane protein [Candidatus Sulfotelmatobacter sp.]
MWEAAPRGSNRAEACTSGINQGTNYEEVAMLWTIVAVLLILWLLGFSLHIAGGLIHLLLVVAVVMIVINLISGRRGTA